MGRDGPPAALCEHRKEKYVRLMFFGPDLVYSCGSRFIFWRATRGRDKALLSARGQGRQRPSQFLRSEPIDIIILIIFIFIIVVSSGARRPARGPYATPRCEHRKERYVRLVHPAAYSQLVARPTAGASN